MTNRVARYDGDGGVVQRTCQPALGYSFAAGTTDGPGEFDFKQVLGITFLVYYVKTTINLQSKLFIQLPNLKYALFYGDQDRDWPFEERLLVFG